MHPAVQDIQFLLASSRALLDEKDLKPDRLQAWGAERNAIFVRLKSRDLALTGDDSSAAEALMRELLEVDNKICARVLENQRWLGEQIAGARKIRQALSQCASHTPKLLQRLA